MKISIITATYNSGATIRDTLECIKNQKHQDIEHIIIDGVSTDTTLSIINTYKDSNNIILSSEPDKGLYDAMNKGIAQATGDIIGILNSDDFYPHNDILTKVHDAFAHDPSLEAVYGDLIYVNQHNTNLITRYWKAGAYEEKNIDKGWIMPHPTLFLKRSVYKKMTEHFKIEFKIAADYELMLRLSKILKITFLYIPETLVHMREGGHSAKNISHRIKGWKELRNAWNVNNLELPFLFIFKRIFYKIHQYSKLSLQNKD